MDISSKTLVLAVNQYMVMCTQQPSVETLLWHIETTIKLCDGIVARTAVTLLRSQWNVIFSVVRFFQQQRGHLEQIMISDVDYCKNELQRQEIHCDAQNALAIQHVCLLSSELEQYCGINFGQAFDFMSFHIMHDTCGIQLTRNHIVGFLSENGAPDGPIPMFANVVAVDAILTRLNNIVQENRNNGSIQRHVVPPGHVICSWHQIQQMQEMLFHLVRVFSPYAQEVSDIVSSANRDERDIMLNCRHCEVSTYNRAVALQQELHARQVVFSIYECLLCCLVQCDNTEEMEEATQEQIDELLEYNVEFCQRFVYFANLFIQETTAWEAGQHGLIHNDRQTGG